MTEIHPKNCLTRVCRFCKNSMTLVNYEFDLEDRVFSFFCNSCEHGITVLEKINDDYFEDNLDGVKHEPLTFEELKELKDSECDDAVIASFTSYIFTDDNGEEFVIRSDEPKEDFSDEFKQENK